MATHAAFLRGVNLGHQRRVSGDQLRTLFEEMGFEGASPFRTSGNVVFEAGREARGRLAERIGRGLADSLGWPVVVFVRTAVEVRAIAGREPFRRKAVQASAGKLQVVLLDGKPAVRKRSAVLAMATADDLLAFGERELFWLPRGGTRESALDLEAIEATIGPTTMRTMGTIEQLAAKHLG
jgi:uncharacterized protein (DUF1697 family)